MKKLLAMLMAAAMLFSLAGCGNKDDDKKETFKCDICEKEQSGKKNELELGDEKYVLCDDCYDDIDGGYADDFSDDVDDAISDDDTFECEACGDEVSGKAYEVEGLTVCKDCYDLFNYEYEEPDEGEDGEAALDNACYYCDEEVADGEGYIITDEDMEAVACDDCFEMAVESLEEEGCFVEGGYLFDEDGTVIGEYEER